MSLTNLTQFPAIKYQGIDQHKIAFHVISTRITYDICIHGRDGLSSLVISPEQQPLNYNDSNYGEPTCTSVKFESDFAPYKPKTDIVINGTAYAPGNQRVSIFDVAVQIGRYKKILRIHGARQWGKNIFGWELFPTEPISSLPIRYEYTAGGYYQLNDKEFICSDNPIGMGWYPSEYLKQIDKAVLPAPQIESPEFPVINISQSIRPEGFGFFGRSWRERIKYAGTYNAQWLDTQHPNLPGDFDFQYWCGAHPSLQIPHPSAGQKLPIKLSGLIPAAEIFHQRLNFYIPVETVFVFLTSELGIAGTKDMQLDTVVIDMHARKVFCTYRITVAETLEVSEIQLRYISDNEKKHLKKSSNGKHFDPLNFTPMPPSLLRKGF